jgi:GNAT superfamily N-acetyltransferase
MLRKCIETDFDAIYDIVNDAAQAYRGVIPSDLWHEPYMNREELRDEIDDGVVFWGYEAGKQLLGIMGMQDKGEVILIRHAYVRTRMKRQGIGTRLLRHLQTMTKKPILIGTWASASWAVSFYRRNGYCLVKEGEKNQLLMKYWSIPERQVETSVVLTNDRTDAQPAALSDRKDPKQ